MCKSIEDIGATFLSDINWERCVCVHNASLKRNLFKMLQKCFFPSLECCQHLKSKRVKYKRNYFLLWFHLFYTDL
jgi:DNA modification methylase